MKKSGFFVSLFIIFLSAFASLSAHAERLHRLSSKVSYATAFTHDGATQNLFVIHRPSSSEVPHQFFELNEATEIEEEDHEENESVSLKKKNLNSNYYTRVFAAQAVDTFFGHNECALLCAPISQPSSKRYLILQVIRI